MAGNHVTVLALNLGRCEDLQCMSMENSTPDRLGIFICKVVSLGAVTVVPPSKGYGSHVLSLKELTMWSLYSVSIIITRSLRSSCFAQWITVTHVVNSKFAFIYSKLLPLRETLVAGSSERTTVHSVACCCIIVVTGN